MSDIAIKVENLSKSYLLGHNTAQAERYTALRDVIAQNAKSLARKTRDMFQGKLIIQGDEVEEFWALKNINLEIKQGDRVGIIGRNGAGKSTLLKILSRITEPTSGRITLNGRIASLLEVGTGFHPELTGRENIFLNGAILGMSRREIQRKFDEIVDFAEVEKFLDTPVKRYSSGMYVRLAFAVAAHLEPEILIVDEVLAVGDAQFQKKCLGKMGSVAENGRTVIFVSHNMDAISTFCSSAILLTNGEVMLQSDDVNIAVNKYISNFVAEINSSGIWVNNDNYYANSVVEPIYFKITNVINDVISHPTGNNEQKIVKIGLNVKKLDPAIMIGFRLFNSTNSLLFHSFATDDKEQFWPKLEIGFNEISCLIPVRLLNLGKYILDLHISLRNMYYIIDPEKNPPTISFEIAGDMSDSPYWGRERKGHFAPNLQWTKS